MPTEKANWQEKQHSIQISISTCMNTSILQPDAKKEDTKNPSEDVAATAHA